MKHKGLITSLALALVLSLAVGALASEVVNTSAKVVPREMSLSLDKNQVDFGDVYRGEEDAVSEDKVTATVESLDYDYSLSLTASALGDIPAANIAWSTDGGDNWDDPGDAYTGDAGEEDYTFTFKITEVPDDAALGDKIGTITFDLAIATGN